MLFRFNHRFNLRVNLRKLTRELQILNRTDVRLHCIAPNLLFYMVLHRQLAALLLVLLARLFVHAVDRLFRREEHFAVGLLLAFPVDYDLLGQCVVQLLHLFGFVVRC